MPKYVTNFDVKVGNTTENVLVRDADLYPKSLTDILLNPANAVYTVGANAMYTTINDALTVAQSDGKQSIILILPGTYNENIDLRPSNNITLYGLGQVIVTSNREYPYGALYVMGTFNCYNITFISTYTGTNPGSYAFHHEQNALNSAGEERFYNCEFISYSNASVGLGIGDATIYFYNCRFTTLRSGFSQSFYCHNAATGTGKHGTLVLKDCWSNDTFRTDDAATYQSLSNSLKLILINNCFSSFEFYDYNSIMHYIPNGQAVSLSDYSYGNKCVAMNYFTRNNSAVRLSTTANNGTEPPLLKSFFIAFEGASRYDWTCAYYSSSIAPESVTGNDFYIVVNMPSNQPANTNLTFTLLGQPKQ